MKDKVFWGTLAILIVTIVPILLFKPDYSNRFKNSLEQEINNIGTWYNIMPEKSDFFKLYKKADTYFVNYSDTLIKQCNLYTIGNPKFHTNIANCTIDDFPLLDIDSIYVCDGFKSCHKEKEQYNSTIILVLKDSMLYAYCNEHDKSIFEQTSVYSTQNNKK
ncbi:hypothetical protein [Bacteroides sp. GM023]|uniref:hypothetical protein n=1 Tax=Bacteroides sp. GM023 TaxID=2723058 RepID=UPI00168B899A|nr:hypothetical protein [Bacteroides sp. GM023]MBD3591119.1 hypothetical protein [Bacteroides sp. GM023]